jgi:hypothetical protein
MLLKARERVYTFAAAVVMFLIDGVAVFATILIREGHDLATDDAPLG